MSEFIMIKAKSSLPSLKFIEESYMANGAKRHFNITGSKLDKETVSGLLEVSYPIYVLVFSEKDRVKKVEHIYLGSGSKCNSHKGISLKVSILQKVLNRLIIENFFVLFRN
uniref:hypothetical protein n=1 Tax=Clostridium sp. NkU-1 TaxID=1095009 RepID=UPI0006D10678